ncbi:hypothetical protein FDECE_6734 [Fusarium decemcellulare]|nr:hypothetical protein FDECE_6734 [Fusarium decemcellulare]
MMSDPPLISPSSSSSENGNEQKGVLQLAILAAAASSLDLKLFTDIDTRLRHTLADSVMVTGQKSIELVQAFTLAVAFYAANEPLHKVRVLSLAAQANSAWSELEITAVESITFSVCNSTRFTEDKASKEDELMSSLDNWKKTYARCLDSSNVEKATALLDSAAAENSNRLHCNSRTFRNVLIRLRTKLDMTEVAIARQVRDEATNLEQIIESVYREEQRQSSTVLPPTNPTLGSEPVSEQDAMTIDIPFDGPISTILNATDNALAGGTMPLLNPDDFFVFNFEELFQTRE